MIARRRRLLVAFASEREKLPGLTHKPVPARSSLSDPFTISEPLSQANTRRVLALAAGAVWLSLLLFVVAMATQFSGAFGPDVQIGWQNRLLIVAYSSWATTVAWLVVRDGR